VADRRQFDMTVPVENSNYKWLRIFFWCAALALGAADAWSVRFAMSSADGVSYLDMGDAYWRGDWHMAINAWWSPLYSWLLGAILKLLKPSGYWEYPLVHLVNLFVYAGTLACFEFFLRAFICYGRPAGRGSERSDASLPEWAWWTLGYSLFIWTSLVLITVRMVTPDMCVAAFVYVASGLLLRIRAGQANWGTFVLLGVVLGFAYLAKAVMFPLAFIFLGLALFLSGSFRKAIPRVLLAGLVFVVVAGPFLLVLSRAKGHLTFGDSGKVNYEVYVDGVDMFFPRGGTLAHPVIKLYERPDTYAFTAPSGGTCPLWYDPSYWHEGIRPYFDMKGQLRALEISLLAYCRLFFSIFMQLNVSLGLLVLVSLAPRPWESVKRAFRNWPLLITALLALALYALVLVDYRYVAAFVCLLWMGAFTGVSLPASPGSQKLIAGVVTFVAATTMISAVAYTRHHTIADRSALAYWPVAKGLAERGINPGDKIAVIANQPLLEGGAFPARLARVQIVAATPRAEDFWAATSSTRSQVIAVLSKTGAKAILTSGAQPQIDSDARWERLGGTEYYLYLFAKGNL
jgi:hypothetical protein